MDVLIVDDHPIVHQTLSAVVKKAIPGAEVHTETSLNAGIERARKLGDLQIALLDLGLPGLTGIQSLEHFRQSFPGVKVVVVSANDEAPIVRAALSEGAAGYLLKTVPPKEMVAALRHIAAGGTYAPAHSDLEADTREESPLTPRQTEILGLIVTGCSNKEIADRLALSEGTVKQHTHAIYQALGVSSRTEALVAAAKLGIKL